MAYSLVFTDSGRTFTCSIESVRPSRPEQWWWFNVSTESDARHAPFRAEPTDTDATVRDRIVAYYDNLLARRAAPYERHWARGRQATPATSTPPATT